LPAGQQVRRGRRPRTSPPLHRTALRAAEDVGERAAEAERAYALAAAEEGAARERLAAEERRLNEALSINSALSQHLREVSSHVLVFAAGFVVTLFRLRMAYAIRSMPQAPP
jgi:hypothetical protein